MYLAAGLRSLADAIESTPELLSAAADSMAEDFLDARAPPADDQVHSQNLSWPKILSRPGHRASGLDMGLHRLKMEGGHCHCQPTPPLTARVELSALL